MIAEALQRVRARLAEAARRAGRDPASVQLLAVSKTKPEALLREAYTAGQRDFGENYAQELRDKARALADLPDLALHAIGALQVNKVKYVAQHASSFHALDRLEVAQELEKRCAALGRTLPCYLEVAIAGEAQKAGVPPNQVEHLADAVAALPHLRLAGLMCLPPHAERAEDSRPHFARLREVSERLRAHHPEARGLSMGMSADFEVAIEEGATVVRVGTTIFGER
jgi:pyridoxal phosphate enzyme (YggS family)